MSYRIKDPNKLSKGELVDIAIALQEYMYYDVPADPAEAITWNPEKELECADLINFLNAVLKDAGLYPKKEGPKDWSPKR